MLNRHRESGCMDAMQQTTMLQQLQARPIREFLYFTSCDDIPEYGCIYADGFGAFNATFRCSDCVTYGGTPCDEAIRLASMLHGITTLYC